MQRSDYSDPPISGVPDPPISGGAMPISGVIPIVQLVGGTTLGSWGRSLVGGSRPLRCWEGLCLAFPARRRLSRLCRGRFLPK